MPPSCDTDRKAINAFEYYKSIVESHPVSARRYYRENSELIQLGELLILEAGKPLNSSFDESGEAKG